MEFDIVIVGGGLVGASFALALKDQAFKIALIDSKSLPSIDFSNNSDARALALSHISMHCLRTLNVWEKIAAKAEPILDIHVSKQNHFGVTRLFAQAFKLPALGYVVNADLLNQVLNQTLETYAHIEVFRPDEILALKRNTNSWEVKLKSEKTLTAKILVAADGSESYLRKHQGISCQVQDHKQVATVANLALHQSHKGMAFERLTETGSIAMLPFGTNQVKCVWVVPEAFADYEMLPEKTFLGKIQNVFGYRLGRFDHLGKRVSFPLRTICAESLYGDRLVLIGNAANTLHPVAAQGFNLGLRDAAALAEILVEANNTQHDIGGVDTLRSYANARRADHTRVRQFTGHLTEPTILQWFGILGCEGIGPLKRWVIEQGLGRQADLPKLCRGIALS